MVRDNHHTSHHDSHHNSHRGSHQNSHHRSHATASERHHRHSTAATVRGTARSTSSSSSSSRPNHGRGNHSRSTASSIAQTATASSTARAASASVSARSATAAAASSSSRPNHGSGTHAASHANVHATNHATAHATTHANAHANAHATAHATATARRTSSTAQRATTTAASTSRTSSSSHSRSTTTATSTTASSRPNHGSGSHSRNTASASATTARATTTARAASASTPVATTSSRPNHGSGSHHRQNHRAESRRTATATATATTNRERANHGSGTHHHHHTQRTSTSSSLPIGSTQVAIAAISAIAGGAAAVASMAVPPSVTPTASKTQTNHRASSSRTEPRREEPRRETVHRSAAATAASIASQRERANHGRSSTRPNHGSGVHSTRHREPPARSHHRHAHQDNQEGGCCECLWNMICGLFKCLYKGILCPLYATLAFLVCGMPCGMPCGTIAVASTAASYYTPMRLTSGGFLVSSLLFVILTINSASDNLMTLDSAASIQGGNLWTLFEGETPRVYLPKNVKNLKVTVDSTNDSTMRAAVFNFDYHGCPPLTGPPVTLPHDSEFDIAGGTFEYDHYNLYKGSEIKANFRQLSGGTYFFLLQGPEALKDIQNGINTNNDHWKNTAVFYRHITTSNDQYSDVDYHIKLNRRQDNDIFTLVYSNESRRKDSSLDVTTDIIESTFDLAGYPWVCDNMDASYWSPSCKFAATQENCVILEAYSVSNENDNETADQEPAASVDSVGGASATNSTQQSVGNGEKTITLRVDTYRDWFRIGVVSVIPWMISLLVSILCCSSCHRPEDSNDPDAAETEQQLQEPLLSPDTEEADAERPPPMNPDHVAAASTATATATPLPSAPIMEEPPMVEAIPIDTPPPGTTK